MHRKQVKAILEEHEKTVAREDCLTCDCYQGLLTQLELDADEDVKDLTEPRKVPREEMHGCLGCKPCDPGAFYAEYLRKRSAGEI